MASRELDIVIKAQDEATAKLRRLSGEVESLGAQAKFSKAASNGLRSVINAAAAAGALLGTTLAGVSVASVKVADDFVQSRIAFDTMLGSGEKAGELLKEITDFARKTPFDLPQVVTGAKQLLAYNIEADKLIPTFNALGNISAGVGRDKLPQLILAFGQVRAAGKLTGQELKQFTEAGVPLLEVLAKQAGKTAAEIKEAMENGAAPSFEEVEAAIFSMSQEGGKFFNLMEEQSKTFGGTISNIRDVTIKFGLAIAGVSETGEVKAGGMLDTLTKKAQELLKWIDNNRETLNEYGEKIGDFIANSMTKLIEIISSTIDWYKRNRDVIENIVIPAIIGLIGMLATLKTAMLIDSAVKGFTSAMSIMAASLTTQTGLVSGLGSALGALPLSIVIAVGMAGIAAAQQQIKRLKEDLDNLRESQDGANEQIDRLLAKAKEFDARGEIDKARRLRDTARQTAEAQSQISRDLERNMGFWSNLKTGLGNIFRADGGVVYAQNGFVPRGTDTVPAMLTPGEMVLNKSQQAQLWQLANGQGGGKQISINIYGNVSTAGGTKDIEDLAQRFGRLLEAAEMGA